MSAASSKLAPAGRHRRHRFLRAGIDQGVFQQRLGFPQHLIQVKLVFVQLSPFRSQLAAEGDELAAMVEDVAGENLVAPVPDLGQSALDLREGERRAVGVRLEESGEGRGGDGSAACGQGLGGFRNGQRDAKVVFGSGAVIFVR